MKDINIIIFTIIINFNPITFYSYIQFFNTISTFFKNSNSIYEFFYNKIINKKPKVYNKLNYNEKLLYSYLKNNKHNYNKAEINNVIETLKNQNKKKNK